MVNNSYLAHHGIKGQKWGVRRFQNPDGTLTAAGKGRRRESGGIVIKKGDEIHRLSKYIDDMPPNIKGSNGYSLRKINDKRFYGSNNADDGEAWVHNFMKRYNGMPVYEHTYTAKKDIRVMPSEETRKVYESLLNSKLYGKQTMKDQMKNPIGAGYEKVKNQDKERIMKLNGWASEDKYNYAMKNYKDSASRASMEVDMLSKTGKRVVKRAKKMGYNAMIDQLGTDTSAQPIIFFDTKGNLKYANGQTKMIRYIT